MASAVDAPKHSSYTIRLFRSPQVKYRRALYSTPPGLRLLLRALNQRHPSPSRAEPCARRAQFTARSDCCDSGNAETQPDLDISNIFTTTLNSSRFTAATRGGLALCSTVAAATPIKRSFCHAVECRGFFQTGYANRAALKAQTSPTDYGIKNDAIAIEELLSAEQAFLWTKPRVNSDGTLVFIEFLHFFAGLQIGGTWYFSIRA